jgi:hypothetical protein
MRKGPIALIALLGVSLPMALTVPADAGTITKDGCSATPLKPVGSGRDDWGTTVVNYRIDVTCGPKRRFEFQQRVREDDDQIFGSDRVFASRTRSRTFNQVSGNVTIRINARLNLPATESGNEEMYHDLRFRVIGLPDGPVGSYTSRTDSPNGSFANP